MSKYDLTVFPRFAGKAVSSFLTPYQEAFLRSLPSRLCAFFSLRELCRIAGERRDLRRLLAAGFDGQFYPDYERGKVEERLYALTLQALRLPLWQQLLLPVVAL